MGQTFIPGYLGEISINAVDYTVVGSVMGISASKNTPRKPVFGTAASQVITGQRRWSVSAQGHVANDKPVSALTTAFALATTIAIAIQLGEDGGATDGGDFAGNGIISSLDLSADADGEWDWSLSIEIDGDLAFTAPA